MVRTKSKAGISVESRLDRGSAGTGDDGEIVRALRPRVRSFIPVLLTIAAIAIPCRSSAQAASPSFSPPGSFLEDLRTRPYAFGDWGGERSKLAERGVTFDFHYSSDLLANVSGGTKTYDTGWGRLRGTMDIDFGKLTSWNGLTFHITGLWQFGANLGADLGALANPSGLVSAHATRLDSFWFQQEFFNGKLFLKAGQFAGQDFYGIQPYGGSFLSEPIDYALGNLFANVYESFDPAATPAAEIRVVPNPHFYVKAAITAANRNPYAQDTNGFHFAIKNNGEGIYEAGFITHAPDPQKDAKEKSYPGSYRVGATYNSGQFTNPLNNVTGHGNYLVYVMANQAVYRPLAGSSQGLDSFFTYYYSPTDVNKLNSETTLGARYIGLFPHRASDSLGASLIYSKISDTFNAAYFNQGLPVLGSEKAMELTYLFQITPWWVLQPDYQHYWSLGANPKNGNSSVLGFRVSVLF